MAQDVLTLSRTINAKIQNLEILFCIPWYMNMLTSLTSLKKLPSYLNSSYTLCLLICCFYFLYTLCVCMCVCVCCKGVGVGVYLTRIEQCKRASIPSSSRAEPPIVSEEKDALKESCAFGASAGHFWYLRTDFCSLAMI